MRRWIFSLVVLTLAAGAARADEATGQLVRNAQYWERHGREDKALQAWQRVLLADPDNKEALLWLGTHFARAGKFEDAAAMLAHLRSAHPGDPGIALMEQAVSTGGSYDALLARARAESRAGHPGEAVALYRQAFASDIPPDDLAIEYYQTLGSTPTGWEGARAGLEKIAGRPGASGRAQLAYAQHLSYHEETRRQSITQLQGLSTDPGVGGQARAAWKQALLWLVAGPPDIALYDSYLAIAPGDPEVMKRQDEARRSVPPRSSGPSPAAAGFAALDRQDIAEAQRIFDAASKANRSDPELLTGVGVVALRQQDFVHAKEVFEKVKAMAPNRPELWEKSLRSATFWKLYGGSTTLRKQNRVAEAQTKMQEAINASPEDAVHGKVAMADLMLEAGQKPEAEAMLRQVIIDKPDEPDALRALSRLVAMTGRIDEAVGLNTHLEEVAPTQACKIGELEAEALRAGAALKSRDTPEEARDMLIAARDADPKNIWVLHDLAGLYLDMDDPDNADAAIDALNKLAPTLPDLVLLRVRQLEARNNPEAALQLMETMPKLTDDNWRATHARLDTQVQISHIISRARRGALTASRLRLAELQKRVQASAELSVLIALAWADLGDNERAVIVADDSRARLADGRPGLRLEIAAVYLRAGRDGPLDALLRELIFDTTLSTRERNDLTRLQVAYAVRSADKLRTAGDLEAAVSLLAPLLHEYPDEPKLLCALGRVYLDAGDPREGLRLFQKVLTRTPDDLEARQGAIQGAVSAFDDKTAHQLADEGLRLSPKNPRTYLVAGRYSVMVGEDDDALHTFEKGREIAESQGPALGSELQAADPDAPIALHLAAVHNAAEKSVGEGDVLGELTTEIDTLQAKKAFDIDTTFHIRDREGFGGFAGLTDLGAQVDATIPLSFKAKLKLTAEPVLLDTGSVDLTDPKVAATLGTYGLNLGAVPMEPFQPHRHRRARRRDLQPGELADHGRRQHDPRRPRRDHRRRGDPARPDRPVRHRDRGVAPLTIEDSYLSTVGITDPLTGRTWGRMLREGGRVDMGITTDAAVLYLIGGYWQVVGEEVPQNGSWMGGAGVEWKLYDWDETKVVAGLAMTYLGYDRNLRYFTLGQGGYFSPQQFIHAGIPFSWKGHSGNLRWETKADLGVNWFREDDTNFFPNDPDLQTQLTMDRDATGAPVQSIFPGQTNISAAIDLDARASYQIAPDIEAGAQVTFRSADWFREIIGGFYVQFKVNKKTVSRSRL